MDADQIEERLLYELRASRHDDLFSGASAVDLVLHIRVAAKTMVAEGRTGDADLAEAFESLRTFLAKMDERRIELGLTEFQERTGNEAHADLCPGLWPFC